ncbi:MAG TPA: RdgB/HAM1 family non-canonical purine NTP pyrophosphatase [Candidatus Eisenbacteria bacterium]|uniref:dITP/XTP pyrophosphatase n=1 Tax=Eiseniibacteriota bacterium TaxID=2212470 RepID=A0A7V2F2S2_UNCEI|nr:RdgB/HAM1 family non-canonical purine NTP pyrophosphatase [Candidatus Eisenbacteria bacterium]
MKIVLATRNEGKIREMKSILSGLGVELLDYRDVPPMEPPEETGETFLENALSKAKAVHAATGLPALADDSGIEVDELGGGPGVRSARYGGEGLSDRERSLLLLEELRSVPEERRGARFRCVMVLYPAPGSAGEALVTEGVFHGRIAERPSGSNGFGYDPVFFVPERGVTAAEMSEEEKNGASHRYRAGVEMKYLLRKRLER